MAADPRFPGQPLKRGVGDTKHLDITRRVIKFRAPWLKPTAVAIAEAKAKGYVGVHMGPDGPIELGKHLRDSDLSI